MLVLFAVKYLLASKLFIPEILMPCFVSNCGNFLRISSKKKLKRWQAFDMGQYCISTVGTSPDVRHRVRVKRMRLNNVLFQIILRSIVLSMSLVYLFITSYAAFCLARFW